MLGSWLWEVDGVWDQAIWFCTPSLSGTKDVSFDELLLSLGLRHSTDTFGMMDFGVSLVVLMRTELKWETYYLAWDRNSGKVPVETSISGIVHFF